MAAVMGHGGDGGDEPPHPFGGGFGDHQNDVVPPKRRGMAVNKKMHKLYKANGERPLKIVFDVNTNMPIGEVYECFIREVGSYMWRDIGFDKDTWTEVSEAERVGMLQYLSRWFDFDAIINHPMASTYWASLNNWICARYRGRKNIAKNRFDDFAGNVEAARAQAPRGMDQQRWNAAIDHFLTEKHQKRSAGNKECRKMQVVKNRGGTCNYGCACFKKNLNRLEVFHRAHVNKIGEFVDPLVEEQYNALVAEVALQTHHIADSGGDPDTIDWIAIFEKVLGTRRGHVRGIGPKAS
ncbi:uncharacterized protein LOC111899573 [Lactuca sativa]|uniref:uncharacterized protein LOC111899573 n=1 Tax=Lactuca sativa TaxID=4236 RepID=UPI0022B032F5|nr:uncharacterized protein LOC111899573 [Lactuca sativa]